MRKSRRGLVLESLENRLVMSVNVVEAENNDSQSRANEFAFEADGLAQLSGTSTSDNDKDYFTFTPAVDSTLSVNVSSPNNNIAQLEVEDPAGDSIFSTEPNNGVNTGSVQLTAGTEYFVRLRSRNASAADYVAGLTLTAGHTGGGGGGVVCGDEAITTTAEVEPNNQKSQATPFTLGVTGMAELTGTSDNTDDRDFFVFTPTVSGTLCATVTTTNNHMPSLEVENPAGIDILETEPNDGVNSAAGQVIAGTQYTVRLRSTDASAAAYAARLNLSEGTGTPPGGGGDPGVEPAELVTETEPNDSSSTANLFGLGSDGSVTLEGVSQDSDDKDYFRFTATESGILRTNVLSPNGNFAAFQIEDANDNKLFETEPNDGINTGAFHVDAGASYRIRLRSKTDSAAEYSVELRQLRDGDLSGDGLVNRGDIADAIRGMFGGTTTGLGADLNHDGVVSLDELVGVRDLIDISTLQPGDVYNETESNNTSDLANTFDLGSDNAIQLHGTSRNRQDDDFFEFSPVASGTLLVSVTAPNSNVAALEIEDSASVDILETEPNNGINVAAAQVIAGLTYFVRLRSKTDSAADYEAQINLVPGGTGGGDTGNEPPNLVIETETNDDKEDANQFALGSDNLVQLQGVSAPGREEPDYDFFTFIAERSGTLTANSLSRSGPFAKVQIEASHSTKVLETEPSNGVNTASGHVTQGTRYYVRMSGGGFTCYYCPATGTSEYLIDLSLEPDTSAPSAPAALEVATVATTHDTVATPTSTSVRSTRSVGSEDQPAARATARRREARIVAVDQAHGRATDAPQTVEATTRRNRSTRLNARQVDGAFANL